MRGILLSMAFADDYVTVYRSADSDAKEQAQDAAQRLRVEEIDVRIYDPDAPGVPIGTYEVRVPPDRLSAAERILASHRVEEPAEEGDPTHALDLVTVFSSGKHDAESEALAIQGMLEAAGVEVVMIISTPIPSLPWEVKVSRAQAAEARALLENARAIGSQAASEAALASTPEFSEPQENG